MRFHATTQYRRSTTYSPIGSASSSWRSSAPSSASSRKAPLMSAKYSASQGSDVRLGEKHPFDAKSQARQRVGFHDHRCEARVPFCRLESSGHNGQKTQDDRLLLDADDRVVRSRHAEVGAVGSPLRKNAVIASRYVRVSPHHRGDASVEVVRESHLLR